MPRAAERNEVGRKFCGECGAPLALCHPAFGERAGVPLLRRVRRVARGRRRARRGTPDGPASERRLVSVLFADLVGFTTLSEARDSEEVRELLTELLRDQPARRSSATAA